MTIISDTTPIISLIKINHLDLLQKLFGEMLIPEAVYRELTTNAVFKIVVNLRTRNKYMLSKADR